MWVFTEWANAFDKVKQDNEKALDSWLQEWVATTLDDKSPWYRNALIYTASGTAYAVNKLSTEVLGGFVDVLRLGDGVKDGGWGYGKDALRLLIVVGPALRAARYGITLVAAVDEIALENCTWIAAARALRLTGTKHYARLGDLAKAAGMSIPETGEAFVNELLLPMNNLGADVKRLGTISSMDAVVNAAGSNPNGVVMFSVNWNLGGTGANVGHTLLATRGPLGVFRIIDRSGKAVSTLGELERAIPGYSGIGNASVYGPAAVVQNARIVTLLNNAPLLANILALELRSVPSPPPILDRPIVVLKTDAQLLTGWWWVQVRQWSWVYHFDAQGGVRWTDPYNLKTGKGTWKVSDNGISVSWAPTSKTTEIWDVPILTGQQTGNYFMQGGPFPLKAMKIDVGQLVGRWKVHVDKWTWNYDFDSQGGVRWTDSNPYNNMTGKGSWMLTNNRVLVSWAPASTTREEWYMPLKAINQDGKCFMQAGKFDLKAEKSGG